MGSVKQQWIEDQQLEPMHDWIADNYGYIPEDERLDNEETDWNEEDWDEAVQAYEDHCDEQRAQDDEEQARYYRYQQDLEWYIHTHPQKREFDTQMKSVLTLVDTEVNHEAKFSLLVMLHGHTVAAVESYLASTFISKVTNSEGLIRKLVETDSDDIFTKNKFSLKEIYNKNENLKITVATYLKELIFHKLDKVKPMFKNVLDCDFGDIGWLFKAVKLRHHCVHRAGLDKDGNKIDISVDSIRRLVENSKNLVDAVESKVEQIPKPEGS